MNEIEGKLPAREPDGQWLTFQQWVNYATRDIGGMNAACYDQKGRRCLIGKDFMTARDDGSFPVMYWHDAGGETPKQQRESKRLAKAALK
jgi:hypothetical protein